LGLRFGPKRNSFAADIDERIEASAACTAFRLESDSLERRDPGTTFTKFVLPPKTFLIKLFH
jgi:hypothetical protein